MEWFNWDFQLKVSVEIPPRSPSEIILKILPKISRMILTENLLVFCQKILLRFFLDTFLEIIGKLLTTNWFMGFSYISSKLLYARRSHRFFLFCYLWDFFWKISQTLLLWLFLYTFSLKFLQKPIQENSYKLFQRSFHQIFKEFI